MLTMVRMVNFMLCACYHNKTILKKRKSKEFSLAGQRRGSWRFEARGGVDVPLLTPTQRGPVASNTGNL